MRVKVLIVDDHQVVREGVRTFLSNHGDIEVIGEFGSGAEVLDDDVTARADVVLMDISMAGMNGLETAARLRELHPHVKIIIFSMHATAEYAVQALHSGAMGYVHKKSTATEVFKAVMSVMAGESYIDSNISRRALENHLQLVKPGELPQAILTARQREVLQLLAEGLGTKEIAGQLGVSPKTVEAHRAQVMERLNIRDLPGLVRYAIRRGLVSPED